MTGDDTVDGSPETIHVATTDRISDTNNGLHIKDGSTSHMPVNQSEIAIDIGDTNVPHTTTITTDVVDSTDIEAPAVNTDNSIDDQKSPTTNIGKEEAISPSSE